VSAVRWTCFHIGNQEYCHREHKSEKAAQNCAKRTAKMGRDSRGWETLEVKKGFYVNDKHKKQ